ncbi:hypothetical protein [Xanthomonas sacchari]|uniref:hypothetical protein n=1 Tax=Xanthomonas sacchari TaxID=56458 RepID=UPI0012E0020C|nr:hypothetical protein [Xanthomonas sacchari]
MRALAATPIFSAEQDVRLRDQKRRRNACNIGNPTARTVTEPSWRPTYDLQLHANALNARFHCATAGSAAAPSQAIGIGIGIGGHLSAKDARQVKLHHVGSGDDRGCRERRI